MHRMRSPHYATRSNASTRSVRRRTALKGAGLIIAAAVATSGFAVAFADAAVAPETTPSTTVAADPTTTVAPEPTTPTTVAPDATPTPTTTPTTAPAPEPTTTPVTVLAPQPTTTVAPEPPAPPASAPTTASASAATTVPDPTTVARQSDPAATTIAPTAGIATPTANVGCNGVAMTAGQADIDANDPGTTFCISGTQSWSLVPKNGDVFIGGTLDGGGTLAHAFSGDATKVTITNVTVVDYSPGITGGAIDATGDGWILRDVTVSGSAFNGVAVGGTNWTIIGGRIYDNGRIGIAGKGRLAADLTINGVELDHNGFTDPTYSSRKIGCGYGAGGVRFESTGVAIRNSFIHDNACQGIWSRLGADDITIVDNRVDDNWDVGIFIDISGNASIQTNEVSGNGFGTVWWPCGSSGFGQGSGILINTSGQIHAVTGSVDVGFNSVSLNCNGITGVEEARTEAGCSLDPACELRNVTIHDNAIVGSIVAGAVNQSGWWADDGSDLTTHALTWTNNDLSEGIVFSPLVPTSPTSTSVSTTTTTTTIPGATTTTTVPASPSSTLSFTAANWPTRYATCATVTDATHLRTDLTSSCNPGGDGHYRTDWSTATTLLPAGETTCVSVPVNFPNGTPAVASGSWWQFAEAVVPGQSSFADWGLYVSSAFGSAPVFDLRMGLVSGRASLWHGGNPASGWNTFVVCSDYSTTNTGFLDLYLNGTKVYGVTGVQIMPAGQTGDALDLNDYTGGDPVPNTVIHGAPRVGGVAPVG